ncbi:MAG TPA: response regulator [Thiobacillaceae bacterium]|nr:response regulator [Thiobacillaceae bacterium]HNA82523.1 response regulator [Thiobacillaceae bacterium]HNF88759.1 response regulator [Thiobacillaceae bacterium]HNI07276.1 response regulator [Thiobacillaceae bacterium]
MGLLRQFKTLITTRRGEEDIPVVEVEGELIPERRARSRCDARPGTRVLIVDDSATARNVLSRMFASAGYQALVAKDGSEGLNMACFERPELILLDIGLPVLNGFEVLGRLRRDPLARRIPVIMMSGNRASLRHYHDHQVDADGVLKKPFTRAAIFGHIEALLDGDRVPRRPA